MSFTHQQYADALARLNRNSVRETPPAETASREASLHEEIEDLCRQQGWYYIHSRMDKPSTIGVGTLDFTIFAHPTRWLCRRCERIVQSPDAMDGGCCSVGYAPIPRVFCFECKAKGGKATEQQLAAIAFLRKLGHVAEVVFNIGQVRQIVGLT